MRIKELNNTIQKSSEGKFSRWQMFIGARKKAAHIGSRGQRVPEEMFPRKKNQTDWFLDVFGNTDKNLQFFEELEGELLEGTHY